MKNGLVVKGFVFAIAISLMVVIFISNSSEIVKADPEDGLVAYWSFDNSSDIGHDDSGNGNHGTNYGATWINNGVSGGALDFDGVNDRVVISDVSDFYFANQSLTYSAWVQVRDNVNAYRVFICLEDYGDAYPHITMGKIRSGHSDGRIYFNTYDASQQGVGCMSMDDGDTLPKDEWMHVAGVVDYESGLVTLYLNGIAQETKNATSFDMSEAQDLRLVLGDFSFEHSYSGKHNGLMDEVRIYDRAFSEEEIQDLYEEYTGVKLFYPTDDTEIAHNSPDVNYGYNTEMAIRNDYGAGGSSGWGGDGLIKFNLSSVPPGSTIQSAMLYLYYHRWQDNNPTVRDINLYRITSDWDEDTVIWNTQPSYVSQPTTNSTVPSSTGVWMDWEVTNDIQGFVDGEETNYGWKITDENYWGQVNIPIIAFRSKEYGLYVPYLVINYTIDFEADFSYAMDNDPFHSLKVQFTDASTSPSPITGWWWDFGDNYYSDLQNPVHCYYSSGIYNVTLIVTNEDSETTNVTKQIEVPIIFDPFSYWQLEEGTGSEANDSAGNNHGTVYGATWTTGKVGGGLSFDGTNDYVEMPDVDGLSFGDGSSDSPFSVAAWIKMDNRNNFIIVGKDEYPNNREFDIRMVTSGYLHFYNLDDSEGMAWIGRKYSVALQNNQWYHVVGTYDGSGSNSGFKIYVNGARVDDADYSGGSYVAMENTPSKLYIGRQSNLYADGFIDEVGLWDEVLSAEQIYEMYTSGEHYV